MNYYIYLVRFRNTLTDYCYCVRLIIDSDKKLFIAQISPSHNNKKFFGVRCLNNLFNNIRGYCLPYYTRNIENLDEEGVYNIVSSVLYMRPKEGYKIDIIRKEKR